MSTVVECTHAGRTYKALLLLDSNDEYEKDPSGKSWEAHVDEIHAFMGSQDWSGDNYGVMLDDDVLAEPGDYLMKDTDGKVTTVTAERFKLMCHFGK